MKAFLSHSSVDKKKVRRIKKDLESHHIKCWIDDEEIPFGGDITSYIDEGLDSSDVLMAFLSNESIKNHWVKTEWQTKFFEQVKTNQISVIPILLEKCELPTLLKNRRYVDFSIDSDYETNLSKLLRQLKQMDSNSSINTKNESIDSVFQFTKEIIDELEEESISLPSPANRKIKIIDSLAKIPRSGKYVRLKKHKGVKPRSIYDHILSVAHVADKLLPVIDHKLNDHEVAELARTIAFHELNEVILGDIPTYTELSNRKRNTSRIYAEDRLRTVPPEKREKIANDLIWMFLSEKQRKSMQAATYQMQSKTSQVNKMFKCLDKLDPIVAIWRYLYVYRGKLGLNAESFLTDMKDFFENPDVLSLIKVSKVDTRLYDLAIFLQTRKNAVAYYNNPSFILKPNTLFDLPRESIRAAIEDIQLFDLYKKDN